MKWSPDKGIAVRVLLLRYYAASRLSEACKSSTTSANYAKMRSAPRTPRRNCAVAVRPIRQPQPTAFGTPSYPRIVIRTSLASSLVGSLALAPLCQHLPSGPACVSPPSAGGARGWSNWRTQVKVFTKPVGITLKRRVISRLYRQAARQQHADEARMSSPHIRHFGLKPRRHSVAGTSG